MNINNLIDIKMRRKMKKELLPEALRFADAVFLYVRDYEIDKLDTIQINETVIINDRHTLFSLSYDPEKEIGCAECSFIALSADMKDCGYYLDHNNRVMSASNEALLRIIKKTLADRCCDEYDIEYVKLNTEERDDDCERIKWKLGKSFVNKTGIYDTFIHTYFEMLDFAEIVYEAYDEYTKYAGLTDYYLNRMGIDACDDELFDLEMTFPIWEYRSFMAGYEMTLVDGLSSIQKIHQSVDPDITTTEVITETIKAHNPSVFITSETFLEEDDSNLDPNDFEYRQTFSVGKISGYTRSIYHGADVIARIYCVGRGIYIIKPLDIFFGNHAGVNYLIVLLEEDGSYSFFTNKKDIVAVVGRMDDECHVLLRYDLKELIPFIASIEELVFDPVSEPCEKSEDEKNFLLLNDQFKKAMDCMRNWIEDDSDDLSLLYSPAKDLISFLKHEDTPLMSSDKLDEVRFVQVIKDRCYGIEGRMPPSGFIDDQDKIRQMELFDYL